MCKSSELEFLDNLDRQELLEVKRKVDAKLKAFRPFQIIEVLKTCSSKDCSCHQDFNQRHGPYLIASYTRGGKQRQKNLGKKYLQAELNSMAQDDHPDWLDFTIRSSVVERVRGEDRREKGWSKCLLKAEEFRRFYGVDFSEDKMGRPLEVHYSRRKYEVEVARWNDTQDVASSEFARFGVGSKKGVSFLRGLLRQGYFLSTEGRVVEF